MGQEGEGRGKEWMKMGRESSCEEEQRILAKEKEGK
jgi:hypothetical protein